MIRLKPYLVLLTLTAALFFCSCQSKSRHLEKAKVLYKQGLELSVDSSLAAAETFQQALLELDCCDPELLEVRRLKGQVKDQMAARYWKQGMEEEALELYKEAIALFRQLPGNVLLMNALQNAGRLAASLHQVDEAEKYYEDALEISRTQSSSKLSKDLILEICHDVYMEKGEYDKVIELVTDAMEKGARADLCQLTLGQAYYHIEDYKHALEFLALVSQSKEADIRMPAYQMLYQIHELKKDYPNALQCLEKYNENMIQVDTDQHLGEIQRIKDNYDRQIQKNTLQAEQRLKTVRFYLIGGLILAVLAVLAVILLLLRQRSLKARLKEEADQRQMEQAFKKNKVFLTAFTLSEKIVGNAEEINFEESEWNDYLELIDRVYGDFTKKLLEQYPTLTKTDLQICGLTRQGFSNQVISTVMNLQANSYARRKYRIKQEKMNGAQDDRSFEEIINAI